MVNCCYRYACLLVVNMVYSKCATVGTGETRTIHRKTALQMVVEKTEDRLLI